MPTPTWERAASGFRELADDLGGTSIRSLLDRGYDIQNGNLVVETSRGAWPVAPGYVAPSGGKVPQGLETAAIKARTMLSTSYERAFSHWLELATAPGGMRHLAFGGLPQFEKNSLSEGRDDTGGFAVPPLFAGELQARAAGLSVIRSRATTIPTISDTLRLPAAKAASSSGSTYVTDWQALWAPEVPSSDSSDPSFQMFEIAVRKLRSGNLKVSEDLANDQPALLGWLTQVGSADLALAGDGGFISGVGPRQPGGILYAGVTELDIEGSTANTISNTTANAGSAPKIADLVANLPAQYRQNARMLASTTAEQSMMTLVDANGNRVYRRGLPVEGLPLSITPFLEASGTDANRLLAVGDWSNYIIASRSTSVRVLKERFAETDQVAIILTERVGGGLWNTDAARLGKV